MIGLPSSWPLSNDPSRDRILVCLLFPSCKTDKVFSIYIVFYRKGWEPTNGVAQNTHDGYLGQAPIPNMTSHNKYFSFKIMVAPEGFEPSTFRICECKATHINRQSPGLTYGAMKRVKGGWIWTITIYLLWTIIHIPWWWADQDGFTPPSPNCYRYTGGVLKVASNFIWLLTHCEWMKCRRPFDSANPALRGATPHLRLKQLKNLTSYSGLPSFIQYCSQFFKVDKIYISFVKKSKRSPGKASIPTSVLRSWDQRSEQTVIIVAPLITYHIVPMVITGRLRIERVGPNRGGDVEIGEESEVKNVPLGPWVWMITWAILDYLFRYMYFLSSERWLIGKFI